MSKIHRVLSIDAWADGYGSWTWNNWFCVDFYHVKLEGDLDNDTALKFFYSSLGFNGPYHKFKALYSIDDDGFNLVLIKNHDSHGESNLMPLYAIEYGSEYKD